MNWKRYLQPLTSRKLQVAIAQAVVVYLSTLGIEGNLSIILTAISIIGGALGYIVGTAIEDAAAKKS